MTEGKPLRTVRSFVRREGRLTPGQQHAIDTLWPQFAIDDGDTLIDLNEVFGRDAPKVLEIGFGNGNSLVQMATNQPDHDFIGVEVHRPGVGQLLKAIKEQDYQGQVGIDLGTIKKKSALNMLGISSPLNKISGPCKAAAKKKFKVWPSAYASGWGVRCTKAGGPSNYGGGKKK